MSEYVSSISSDTLIIFSHESKMTRSIMIISMLICSIIHEQQHDYIAPARLGIHDRCTPCSTSHKHTMQDPIYSFAKTICETTTSSTFLTI